MELIVPLFSCSFQAAWHMSQYSSVKTSAGTTLPRLLRLISQASRESLSTAAHVYLQRGSAARGKAARVTESGTAGVAKPHPATAAAVSFAISPGAAGMCSDP